MEMLSDVIKNLQKVLEEEGDVPIMTNEQEGSSYWGWSGFSVQISKGYDVWQTNPEGIKELRRTTDAGAVDWTTNKYKYLPEGTKYIVTY